MRCARPIGFDLNYTSLLGRGVYTLFEQGHTKCMVSQTPDGEVIPLFLDDLRDENGRIKTRMVDMESPQVKSIFNMLHFLTEDDVNAAAELLPNPEEYLFDRILEW
jgi:6-phosphofructokinase 1